MARRERAGREMRLETRALHWLMYARKCEFAVCERSPRYNIGQPDCLGVTRQRQLVEIEVKRSISDFRAQWSKQSMKNRNLFIDKMPYQFYILCPHVLGDRIFAELPEWAGLMTDSEMWVRVLKVAPLNREHVRLSLLECRKLMRCVSNHICAAEEKYDQLAFDAGIYGMQTEETDIGIEYRI